MILVPLLLLLQAPSVVTQTAPSSKVHVCSFSREKEEWKGSCGRLGGEYPTVTIKPAKAITSGKWRENLEPTNVWAGNITYSDDVVPVEIEIDSDRKGVLRSADGWFPISRSVISDKTMELDIDFTNEVAPSELDREIVRRVALILSSEAVWNRADNRKCSLTETKWSIYCAMEKATVDVTGGFHHRRPALQVVRKIVRKGPRKGRITTG